MTSCPSEEELVLFVEDGDAGDPEVGDHVVVCADCRRLVARSEAALRYALGGVADRERIAAPRTVRRVAWPRLAAAAAVLAALGAGAAVLTVGGRDDGVELASPRPRALASSLGARLDELLAHADRLGAPVDDVDSGAALAALAAAEVRIDLGLPTAEARLRDVVERFPGTPESREARARLALLGGGR